MPLSFPLKSEHLIFTAELTSYYDAFVSILSPAYIVTGALTGFIVGLTGVGGGSLMTPLLLLCFGVNPATAIATDLWFAAFTKIAGARVHHEAGKVDWEVVRRLWWGSIPAALIGVALVTYNGGKVKLEWLNTCIGIVVLITALGFLLSPRISALAANARWGSRVSLERAQPVLTVIAGAVIGLFVAFTSIGAGVIASVALLYLYPVRMDPHRLVATDIVHAIPLAIVTGMGYLFAGKVDGAMLMNLLIGSIPTVIIGSKLSGKFQAQWIRVALAVILIAAGLKLLL